jgi:Gram-negative bacterial TonB protein C-terminal
MKFIYFLSFLLYSSTVNSQVYNAIIKDTVYKVEQLTTKPQFKESLVNFYNANLAQMTNEAKKEIQGYVEIEFIIQKNGTISNVEKKETSPQSNEVLVNTAIALIKKTNGKWQVGKIKEEAKSCLYKTYVGFFLNEDNKYVLEELDENQPVDVSYKNNEDKNGIFNNVEIQAKFNDWYSFLRNQFQYPNDAIEQGVQGNVIIDFELDKRAKIINVRYSINSAQTNKLLVKEAARIIKLTSGLWIAGMQNGEKVKTYHSQGINFVLASDD